MTIPEYDQITQILTMVWGLTPQNASQLGFHAHKP